MVLDVLFGQRVPNRLEVDRVPQNLPAARLAVPMIPRLSFSLGEILPKERPPSHTPAAARLVRVRKWRRFNAARISAESQFPDALGIARM